METEVTTVESKETNVWTSELERSPIMKRGIGGRNAPVCFQTGSPGGKSVWDYDLLLRVGLCFPDVSLTPLMCFGADKDELNIFYLFKNSRPTILTVTLSSLWLNQRFIFDPTFNNRRLCTRPHRSPQRSHGLRQLAAVSVPAAAISRILLPASASPRRGRGDAVS